MSKDIQTARAALVDTQQQVALLLHAGATAPQLPVAWPETVSPVAYATTPPIYMPPPLPAYTPPSYPPIPIII